MGSVHITEKRGEKKGTIVFLHGSSSSSKVFDEAMHSEKLPYDKVSFDFPGHGRSEWYEDANEYGMDCYRRTLGEVVSDLGDVLLVGNSLGGHVAIEMANEVDRLKGLVIFATPPVKNPLHVAEGYLPNPALQCFFTESVPERDLDAVLKEAITNSTAIPMVKADFLRCDPRVRGVIAREVAGGTGFTDEHTAFRTLKVPRYILHGRQDPTTNYEYLKALCRECEGDVEMTVVENCGHYISIEQAGIFVDKVAEIASKTLL